MAVRTSRAPVTRGCGSRKPGGVYLCTGTSEHGLPIEAFLIDPVRKFDVECFRAPIVVPDPENPDVNHIAVWVGKEHYPTLVDFVEETRRLGASRRIPQEFDFSVLTPGKSRMFLIHPLAFTERIDETECPQDREDEGHGDTVPCVGAHWAYAEALGAQVEDEGGSRVAKIGQCRYTLSKAPITVSSADFSPGAFLQLPITHVEYQSFNADDEGPEVVNQRAAKTGFEYVIVDDASQTGEL